MPTSTYTAAYLSEVASLAARLEAATIDRMIDVLLDVRSKGGRVFFLGVGGGAGHAGHAVNDFRKIAGIECYAPTDNVSELTARINDEGWESCYANWLRGSHLSARDSIFIFSVGGGNAEHHVSMNLVAWPLAVLVLIALYDLDENTLLIYNGLFWVVYVTALTTIEMARRDRHHTAARRPHEILKPDQQSARHSTAAAPIRP